MNSIQKENPLGYEKPPRLLKSFAIPSIIAMLVSSLYNIVDQVFIGQGVGYLGNAATNVAFPLTTISLAIALLIGIGSASLFSLNLGAGKKEDAAQVVGTAFTMMLVFGVIYAVLIEIFLVPLLTAFGATAEIMPYAKEYTRNRYAFSDCQQWDEQPRPGRRKSEIFHDLYADRCDHQHHTGSGLYFYL